MKGARRPHGFVAVSCILLSCLFVHGGDTLQPRDSSIAGPCSPEPDGERVILPTERLCISPLPSLSFS
jgi:hypothetical protein